MEGKLEKLKIPELTPEEIRSLRLREDQLKEEIDKIDRESARRKKPLEEELEGIQRKLRDEVRRILQE